MEELSAKGWLALSSGNRKWVRGYADHHHVVETLRVAAVFHFFILQDRLSRCSQPGLKLITPPLALPPSPSTEITDVRQPARPSVALILLAGRNAGDYWASEYGNTQRRPKHHKAICCLLGLPSKVMPLWHLSLQGSLEKPSLPPPPSMISLLLP